MSIEEVFESLERYARESGQGDRKVDVARHFRLMAGTALLLAGGFQFSEDPERRELLDARELDREQRPRRLQARQYGWSYADQARA
jgi:hypothetical protein